jgi:hypothetical protein
MVALPDLPAGKHIPCSATSAMDACKVENRPRALGAGKFTPKPFFPGEVLKAIHTAVIHPPGHA